MRAGGSSISSAAVRSDSVEPVGLEEHDELALALDRARVHLADGSRSASSFDRVHAWRRVELDHVGMRAAQRESTRSSSSPDADERRGEAPRRVLDTRATRARRAGTRARDVRRRAAAAPPAASCPTTWSHTASLAPLTARAVRTTTSQTAASTSSTAPEPSTSAQPAAARQVAVGLVHGQRERVVLALEPVARPVPPSCGARCVGTDVEHDHEVGDEPGGRPAALSCSTSATPSPRPDALVRERRRDEAVAHDPRAARQRRPHDLGDVLRRGRRP